MVPKRTEPRRGIAHDALLGAAIRRVPEAASVASGKLDWLYEFEEIRANEQPSKEDTLIVRFQPNEIDLG